MVAALARSGMGGVAALLARLADDERREREAAELAERSKRHRVLTARLHTWGDYQREGGYDAPGIDYDRPRVIGNHPGSNEPAPIWYLALCAAVAALPEADERAIRRVYIYGDAHPRLPHAFAALLAAGMGEQ